MRSISDEEIRTALSMSECIDVMEELFRKEASLLNKQPLRTLARIDTDSIIFTMPSYSAFLKRFAVKIVSEYKNNPKKFSLPVQGGIIVLIDAENSQVLSLLDSASVTAIRTGAVSGLATKLLSRMDSKTVAVIGSGQQARTQLQAVCEVRGISNARVYSREYEHSSKFAKEMSAELGILVEAVHERKDATKSADIIIVATNSSVPAFRWEEAQSGCHINSIGTLPDRREVDEDTVCNSLLFVDTREGVLAEAGDIISAIKSGRIDPSHIRGNLSDILLRPEIARQNDEQVTLFKSVGFALLDVYASSYVFDKLR